MDPILGMITLWPLRWVPDGYALCDGTLLQVSQNQALFSLLGNIYGGNGSTTFALPDLRNRVPLGGQTVNSAAQTGGAAQANVVATGAGSFTLSLANMPAHTHTASFTPSGSSSTSVSIGVGTGTGNASTVNAGSTVWLSGGNVTTSGPDSVTLDGPYSTSAPSSSATLGGVTVSGGSSGGTVAVGSTGSGQAVPIQVQVPVSVSTLQPSLALNFIIATVGTYPMRP